MTLNTNQNPNLVFGTKFHQNKTGLFESRFWPEKSPPIYLLPANVNKGFHHNIINIPVVHPLVLK